jgi:hypothetical protein
VDLETSSCARLCLLLLLLLLLLFCLHHIAAQLQQLADLRIQ